MGVFTKLNAFYVQNRVSCYTIAGVLLGLLAGLATRRIFLGPTESFDPYVLRCVSLPGALFIRVFLILIIPLLITSLSISMISHQNILQSETFDSKKLVLFTIGFFVATSACVSIVGITSVAILKPGISDSGVSQFHQPAPTRDALIIDDQVHRKQEAIIKKNQQFDSMFNIVFNIFPNNLLTPMFSTSYQVTKVNWPSNMSEILDDHYVPSMRIETSTSYKSNMMGICMLSLMLGFILQKLGQEKTATFRQFLFELGDIVNQAMMFLVRFMPVGMFCWMYSEGLKMHSIESVAFQLIYFLMIAFGCFSVLLFIAYPLVYYIFTRENPYALYPRILPAIMVAVGSTSSAITLPMTLQCMERDNFLPKSISKVVLPLGMTIHMNGSALYYPMVAVFIAQMKGVQLEFISYFVLTIFAVVMSMGFPGTPSGGATVVNHIAFATVIGVENPQDVLAFIIAFEWIMERVRTSTNIIGDCFVSKCVQSRFASKNYL